MIEYFTKKKEELLATKAELEAVDYSEQICKEVDDFKIQKEIEIAQFEKDVTAKYGEIKAKDIRKVDYYIEFVDEEIDKIVKKEAESIENNEQPIENVEPIATNLV